MDVEDFVTPMQKHGFDLYLNGHTHLLNQYSIGGAARMFFVCLVFLLASIFGIPKSRRKDMATKEEQEFKQADGVGKMR